MLCKHGENSPYKCYNVVRKITSRANVQKSVATVNGRNIFGLIADRDIPAFTEILVNYGPVIKSYTKTFALI